MLDAFIIEEIRRREQEGETRPRPQLPIPEPARPLHPNENAEEEDAPKRGVVIIDYTIPASP